MSKWVSATPPNTGEIGLQPKTVLPAPGVVNPTAPGAVNPWEISISPNVLGNFMLVSPWNPEMYLDSTVDGIALGNMTTRRDLTKFLEGNSQTNGLLAGILGRLQALESTIVVQIGDREVVRSVRQGLLEGRVLAV